MAGIGIMPPKPDALQAIFGVARPIIGMIHLPPLPGGPRFAGGSLRPVLAAALVGPIMAESGRPVGINVLANGALPTAGQVLAAARAAGRP